MMDIFKRKAKDVEGQRGGEYDAVEDTGLISENASAERRQKLILYGGVAVVAFWRCTIFWAGAARSRPRM